MNMYVLTPLISALAGVALIAAIDLAIFMRAQRAAKRDGETPPPFRPDVLLMFLAAVLVGGVAGAVSIMRHTEDTRAHNQAVMHKKVEAKYRVLLDPKAALPLSGNYEPVQVIALVDGQPRQCSVQIVKKDPFVFCANGVEADRAAR